MLVRAYVADWVKANPIPDADAAQGIRHDQGADGRQGIQGPPHPRREGRRGEGHHRRSCRRARSSRSSPSARRIRARRTTAATSTGTRRATSSSRSPTRWSSSPKGKFTTAPVQTQFGWHVIEVDDIRDAKVPTFDEVKPQLQQRMQGQQLDTYFKELRAKNGAEDRKPARRHGASAVRGCEGQATAPALFLAMRRSRSQQRHALGAARCYSSRGADGRQRVRAMQAPAASRGIDGSAAQGGMHGGHSPSEGFSRRACCSSRSASRRSSSAATTRSAPRRGWVPATFRASSASCSIVLGAALALRALRLKGPPLPRWHVAPDGDRAGQRRCSSA